MSSFTSLPFSVTGQRIGLYGGSFDPPHKGHLHVANLARKTLNLSQVWWLVSPGNPLKSHQPTLSFQDRVEAVGAIIARNPFMRVVQFEQEKSLIYTADSLGRLLPLIQERQPVLILGADNLASLHHWYRWRFLMTTLPLAFIDRPPFTLKASATQAVRAFSRYQINNPAALAESRPPAWTLIRSRKNRLSSTQIREQASLR